MKNIIIFIIIIAIAVGGWWFYKNLSPVINNDPIQLEKSLKPIEEPVVSPSPTTSAVKEFTVTGTNFSFAPSVMKVKKGDTVKIIFKNSGGMHDLRIDEFNGAATKVIPSGAQEAIQFVADKTGTFEYYCSVGTHRQMGMKGTLTVE